MSLPDNPDRWLTPPEVADMWNISVRRVRNWIRRHRVTVRDDGKIDGESVYEYLDQRGTVGQHRGARPLGEAATRTDAPQASFDAGRST